MTAPSNGRPESKDTANDDAIVWEPEITKNADGTEDKDSSVSNVLIYEKKGNKFHLSAVIRKYTSAKVEFRRTEGSLVRKAVVVVSLSQLWDVLGLLRSLQYDVEQFNSCSSVYNPKFSSSDAKYRCFRLTRQAAAMGVRLPPRGGEELVEVDGLNDLVEYIEKHFADAIATARSSLTMDLVDFESLQEYYTPGKLLVDHGVGTGVSVPTGVRVRACFYSRRKSLFGIASTFYVALEVVVATANGEFCVVEAQYEQSPFNGTRSTREAMELSTVPSDEELKILQERGRTYQVLSGVQVGDYKMSASGSGVMVEYATGTFLATSTSLSNSSRTGSYSQASRSGGRMMVDAVSAWGRGVHCAKHQGVASDAVVGCLRTLAERRSQQASAKTRNVSTTDNYTTSTAANPDADTGYNDLLVLTGELPDSLLPMTWPVVPGFSLQARTWGVAMVHGTKPVQFRPEIFQSLVLPAKRKTLLQALVTSHSSRPSADIVAGKGDGTIFLLHGPPGVGKTLTAEAIAELLHKPLYVVSMGELGTSPETLEARLQDVLDLCVPWQALVLIDEAEMLLERRTKNDIVRNAMVCVMLRLLEYYSGILFLTTNRVESLDPAFQSRVTCALRYDALSTESRKEIWMNMMKRLEIDTKDIDLDKLSLVNINGRQIKNTLQLAVALAQHEGVPVSQTILETTLDVTTSFLDDAVTA